MDHTFWRNGQRTSVHPCIPSGGAETGPLRPVTLLVAVREIPEHEHEPPSHPELGGVTSPELHGVPAGNRKPSLGRARNGCHQVTTIGALGFCPLGKCRESCPGVDGLP